MSTEPPVTTVDWQPGDRLLACTTHGSTMGTRFSARFHAPLAADVRAIGQALAAAVGAVDRQMSNWNPASDLSRLNRTPPGTWTPVPADLATVLARAMAIGRETGGAFHIGLGDLVDAWGFGPSRAPAPDQLPAAAQARPSIDALLEVDAAGGRARRLASVALDLCGIAKGFGVDALARVLQAHGIGHWLVGIDGELRAHGGKPDGTAWAIALEAPDDARRAAMAVIELGDAAIATSGDYRHCTTVQGQRLSHTMDPRTQAPLVDAPASVTVIAPSCMDADAYATALMVLGEADGRALAQRLGLDTLVVRREAGGLRTSGTGAFDSSADPLSAAA